MRQLSKEEIKKMVLGGLLFLMVVYGYFTLLLGPLGVSRKKVLKSTADFQPKIAEAQNQIKRTENIERSAEGAAATVKAVAALIPDGSPVAWFPPKVAEIFKREGVDRATTRLASDAPERDMAGYRRLTWTVELPKADFLSLAQALASFENQEPLAVINTLQIDAGRTEPGMLRAGLTLNNIVKQ